MTINSDKIKVGILTWHYYNNVGSNLQAWALQHFLCDMGFEVRFVNYRKRELDGGRFPKGLIKSVLDFLPFGPKYETWHFQCCGLNQTRKTYDAVGARMICNEFDAVVCGSDQIWAPNVFDPVYMLEGVSDRVLKISYAASIGIPIIPEELKPCYKELLSHFDAVGVREEQGRALLEELGIQATTVLDPTLLLDRKDWDGVAARGVEDSDCIFCYFLGEPRRYAEAVEKVAKRLGCSVIVYLPEGGEAPIPNCKVVRKMGPAEFLARVRSAKLVLTDSFHGIALSVVYETEFVAFRRFAADSPINQNSRVENILTKLGLMDRLISSNDVPGGSIDWSGVRLNLQRERKASWRFLRNALEVRDA